MDLLALPAARFLNVVYAALLARLPEPEREGDNPRRDADDMLGTAGWDSPAGARYRIVRDEGAPSWWFGEEEASQAWLSQAGMS